MKFELEAEIEIEYDDFILRFPIKKKLNIHEDKLKEARGTERGVRVKNYKLKYKEEYASI